MYFALVAAVPSGTFIAEDYFELRGYLSFSITIAHADNINTLNRTSSSNVKIEKSLRHH